MDDCKVFIQYSNGKDDIYKNTEKWSPNKKLEILIVFDDMIADIYNSNITREAAKILALSSDKIDKYEYFTGE